MTAALAVPLTAFAVSDMAGWGWSENAGWLSMHCDNESECGTTDYGVEFYENNGVWEGHALFNPEDDEAVDSGTGNTVTVPNIGYLYFGPYTKNFVFPNGAGTVDSRVETDLLTGDTSGWARGCALFTVTGGGVSQCFENILDPDGPGGAAPFTDNLKPGYLRGGWDGWVSMSGTAAGGYGVNLDPVTGQGSGYAWGGDVLGWIDFSDVTVVPWQQPPTALNLTITADPLVVSSSGTGPGGYDVTELTWETTDGAFTHCQATSPQGMVEWDGTMPPPPAVGVPASQSDVSVPASVTTFSIRCSEDYDALDPMAATWTDWASVDVEQADITFDFVGGQSCVDPATGSVFLEYGTSSSNLDECWATSSGGTGAQSNWTGALSGVYGLPSPGNPVQVEVPLDVGFGAALPITWGIQCIEGSTWHPPSGPLEIVTSDLCAAPTPPEMVVTTNPTDCVDALPTPGNPELVDIIIDIPSNTAFESCNVVSIPNTPTWDGPEDISPIPDQFTTTTYSDIEVISLPQRFRTSCTDNETSTTLVKDNFIKYLCGVGPTVDLTTSAAPSNEIPAPGNIDVSWTTEYADSCNLNVIPTSVQASLGSESVGGSELPDDTRSNVSLTTTSYFYMRCFNPYEPDGVLDTETVCVGDAAYCSDPNNIPTNPCDIYDTDPACVAKKPIYLEV